MDLLVNDLSVHEQFHDIESFGKALARLMTMRNVARRLGREVHCQRAVLAINPIPGVPMQQAIGRIADKNVQRAVMIWLTQGGPFWDDLRQHDADDWLEFRGKIVTDTAVGEAAFRTLHSIECGLVSVSPSDWEFSPVEVVWHRRSEDQAAAVENWYESAELERRLLGAASPVRSWVDLRNVSINRFRHLNFADNCFEPLHGVPFAKSSADRLLVLLDILDRLRDSFDDTGGLTTAGKQIRQDYFTGDKALFSDSSHGEKSKFRDELTFPHPNDAARVLFCTWHGKERHLNLRLHFSWPIASDKPVYVVYAGPKITRQ